MITFFSRFGVTDYDAWKEKFEAVPDTVFAEAGVVETTVYRGSDGNEAIVLHIFNTWQDAREHKAFMESQPQSHFDDHYAIAPIRIWLGEEM